MIPPLGIDLGTTRTAVAVVDSDSVTGRPKVLRLTDGEMTPSAILFEADRHSVGVAAKNMGHRFEDCAQIFKREMPNGEWSFSPAARAGAAFHAQDLSAILLGSIAAQARNATGLPHDQAVITVPAYFGEPERRRTADAAKDAGLTVLDIINEPTAAMVAYLFQPFVEPFYGSVLVFDLGGGTFDTVVVDVHGDNLHIAAIHGDLLLGGRDFDATIATTLADRFESAHPLATRPTADPTRRAQLLLEIERTRETLSSATEAHLPVWGGGDSATVSLDVALTRADIDQIVSRLVDRCIEIAKRAVSAGASSGSNPTRVLFVGGMTRTPTLRDRVMAELGLEELSVGADPDLMVAKGAAIWAQKLALEQEFMAASEWASLDSVEWESDVTRKIVRDLSTRTGYSTAVLQRLLRLRLKSMTAQGYALQICQGRDDDTLVLSYLIPAGAELPFEGEPRTYVWRNEVSGWGLSVFEDTAENRGIKIPDEARFVERVTGPMSRTWPGGSELKVQYSMGMDQIVRVRAWQLDGEYSADELDVEVSPGWQAQPSKEVSLEVGSNFDQWFNSELRGEFGDLGPDK